MQFYTKKVLSRKRMYFFVFFHQQMKIRKKHWKNHILGRIFFFIQIAYIILVKGGWFKIPLILLKKLKNTSFMKFLRKKKVYCRNFHCVLFIFYEKQWNKQKIIEKSIFSVKRNFFREMAYISFSLSKEKDGLSKIRCYFS